MRKFLALYRYPVLLTLFLVFLHFLSVDITNPYEKPIAGDAQAYYAYLPAIFIYQDLDFDFTEEVEQKHYPPGSSKSFMKEVKGGEKVNKTFPGVAILYLPFFLVAHLIATVFGLEADGYSFVYQLCFDIGFWVYFFLGLIFSLKVLYKMGLSERFSNLSLVIITLGTNIFFYSVYDMSVTHIYNFFLIALSLYFLFRFKEEKQFKFIAFSLLLFCIMCITRPTNILALLLILFFIPDSTFYKEIWKNIMRFKNIFIAPLIVLSILSIPLILWKAQTGHWIVYSYGEEGFNFVNPQIIPFLFSYIKGWWTYTPIALLILIPGFIILFKRNKKRFFLGVTFYFIAIYIFSSWWCWYYGAGMSQRVMIDFSILLMFLLATVLQNLKENRLPNAAMLTACFLLIGVNMIQARQIKKGILPFGTATKEQYWDNFLSLEKKARVYPFEHWNLLSSHDLLTAKETRLIYGEYKMRDHEPHFILDKNKHYTAVVGLNNFNALDGSKIAISFESKAETTIELTRLVLKIDDDNEKVFFLKDYVKKGEWILMEFLYEPSSATKGDLQLYFWNGDSDESLEIRNIRLRHYYSEGYF